MHAEPSVATRNAEELLSGIGPAWPRAQAQLSEELKRVVVAAERILGVDGVGLQLLDEQDRLRAVASSGPKAAALERAQQDTATGSAVDTVRDAGGYAVLSAPIWVNGEVAGSLSAFCDRPHRWQPAELRAAQAYAEVVAVLLQLGAGRLVGESAPHSLTRGTAMLRAAGEGRRVRGSGGRPPGAAPR